MVPHIPFYFIRHGQTDWNLEGRMQGHTNIPLNATGIAQAQQACASLQTLGITRVISSPLSRALQTAEILAASLNLPVETDANLMERTFGSYEGRLTEEVRAEHNLKPEESISKILPPDAEQWPQTLARSQQAIAYWLTRHPADKILFVSHGAFFRALYEALGGPRLEAKNATPYHFQPAAPAWQLTTL